jgi:hypothetical protein
VSIEQAREQVADMAALAQEMGGIVLVTENPFTGNACGYQVYFDNGRKQEFYELALIYLRAEQGSEMSEWRQESEIPPDYWEDFTWRKNVELMFDAVPLNAVASGCADLCAPFSS